MHSNYVKKEHQIHDMICIIELLKFTVRTGI